jgi:hypothetical protein
MARISSIAVSLAFFVSFVGGANAALTEVELSLLERAKVACAESGSAECRALLAEILASGNPELLAAASDLMSANNALPTGVVPQVTPSGA